MSVGAESEELDPDQLFDWFEVQSNLYLQSSISFLSCGAGIRTGLPVRYPCLSITSMGITLMLEPPREQKVVEAPDRPLREGWRVCDFAIMGMHMGHPRFAAMRKAVQIEPLVRRPQTYAQFMEALAAGVRGELSREDARQLVVDIINHALKVSRCEDVRLDPRVESALRYSAEKQIFRVQEVASAMGLSASRLSHLFTEHVGMSFRQYALWCRTILTWNLVVFSPEKSLTEIAYEMEFADLAHLSRAFKLVFGVTPSALREKRHIQLIGGIAPKGRRVPFSSEWPC